MNEKKLFSKRECPTWTGKSIMVSGGEPAQNLTNKEYISLV